MSKIGVFIKFTAKSGKQDDLVEHFQSLIEIANKEKGTEDWSYHVSPLEPDVVFLYEVYKDQEAKDLHDSNEFVVKAKAKTHDLTVGIPDVIPLIPIAGKGLS